MASTSRDGPPQPLHARTPGFLAERLAAASAVPAEQRSADVRAFIETCRLQAELAEELGLPPGPSSVDSLLQALSRWTLATALKLVRCHFIGLASTLHYSPEVHDFASHVVSLTAASLRGGTAALENLEQDWIEILESDPCLTSFAILAAGLSRGQGWNLVGFLRMTNSAVALMQRPAVRRRLRAELAALPEQWVSYEELLAVFVDWGSRMACAVEAMGDGAADAATAVRLAADLLPQLAPDSPRLRYMAASRTTVLLSRPTAVTAALEVARQQGSDYFVALGGYDAASGFEFWQVAAAAAVHGVPPPSAMLAWLQDAEAAHRRCRALLPKEWTRELDDFKAAAKPGKAVLQRLKREGDRWRRLNPAELDAGWEARDELKRGVTCPGLLQRVLWCSGCGRVAAQLRLGAACKEVQ